MKFKIWLCCLFSFLGSNWAFTQNRIDRPALIVGIVVDQMRYDFIYRYYDKFGEGGFKRLVQKGYFCENVHYDYMPTYTGPGHASIYTGTTPAMHGIAANTWYQRDEQRMMYCVQDDMVQSVGGGEKAGKMSPKNLQSSTIGDQLRLAFGDKSKVVAVALKDRASILPGGFNPTGAYWFDKETGNFITSSYYTNSLPQWVQAFNNRKLAETMRQQTWQTLLPIELYTESTADDMPWEGNIWADKKPTFPYHLAQCTEKGFDVITKTPFGNTITTELAKAAITAEQLGKDATPDLLALSYSSTDIVGHIFGPQSIEVQDTYLRLDRDLADLFSLLDKEVGKRRYAVFLTADHGILDVPAFSSSRKIPSRLVDEAGIRQMLTDALQRQFNRSDLVEQIANMQIYWNEKALAEARITKKQVNELAMEALSRHPDILTIVPFGPGTCMYTHAYINEKVSKGMYPRRSGDLCIVLKPGILESNSKQGTSHGSPYQYDTHVPLLWYGWRIKEGNSFSRYNISDIASTVCSFLKILPPNANIGSPIPIPLKP